MATEFTQGRIRVNRHGALLLRDLLNYHVGVQLSLRKAGNGSPDLDDQRHQLNLEINRARRVLAEVNRAIDEHWPINSAIDEPGT